jgi:hypothetical protein
LQRLVFRRIDVMIVLSNVYQDPPWRGYGAVGGLNVGVVPAAPLPPPFPLGRAAQDPDRRRRQIAAKLEAKDEIRGADPAATIPRATLRGAPTLPADK